MANLDPTKMKDWEIAEAAEEHMKTVYQLREEMGLEERELFPYGHYVGKVDYMSVLNRLKDKPNRTVEMLFQPAQYHRRAE